MQFGKHISYISLNIYLLAEQEDGYLLDWSKAQQLGLMMTLGEQIHN